MRGHQDRGVIGPIYAAPINPCPTGHDVPWAKPIRIYQFILVTALFIITLLLVIDDDSPYVPHEATAMSTLFGAYLLITFVDLISQCGRDPIPDTPMFLFGIFGSILFFMAAGYMLLVSRKDNVGDIARLLISMILAIGCAILFIIDISLIFLYGY